MTSISHQHVLKENNNSHVMSTYVSDPEFDWVSIYRQNSCLIFVLIYIKTNLNFKEKIIYKQTI
jgi:hypothetical protein